MADVYQQLQTAGLRPTRQRVSLGELLFDGENRHVTAEWLFDKAVIAKIPVSLATVYNTLNQFTQAGLLREVIVEGAKTYFDTNMKQHHHFYRETDGQLIDIPEAAIKIESLPMPPEGMEISQVSLMIKITKGNTKNHK